ncbi:MAG: peroxiredoxin [Acidobacteria bacterium]|nr:MAG: peroxiredoxin [Acidobacteriota bacterium]
MISRTITLPRLGMIAVTRAALGAGVALLAGERLDRKPRRAVGSPAPDFSLTTNEGHPASLKDFRGKWVVLYFYPKDFTGGCTLEAHNFQRDLAKYEKANAAIVGVSVDTAESHKSFCAKEGLAFKLLSDPDAKVSTQYGSVMEYNGAKLAARNTFVVDPQGKIAKVFTGVKPATHSDEVLSALTALQSH